MKNLFIKLKSHYFSLFQLDFGLVNGACSVFSPLQLSRHAQPQFRPFSSFESRNLCTFEANVKADESARGLLQEKIGVLALALYKKLASDYFKLTSVRVFAEALCFQCREDTDLPSSIEMAVSDIFQIQFIHQCIIHLLFI